MTDTTATTPPTDPFAMTPEQATDTLTAMAAVASPPPPIKPEDAQDARARLDVLSRDKGWADRLFNGDVRTRKEFDDLLGVAAGGDDVGDAIAGIVEEPPIFQTTQGGELPARHVQQTIEALREAGLNDGTIEQAIKLPPVTRADAAMTRAFQSKRHGDAEWVARLLAGDYEAKREFTLMSIILASPVEG